MNIADGWQLINEALNKTFYSDSEAMLDTFTASSQISEPRDQENTYISYDPFGGYVNNQVNNNNIAQYNYNEMTRRWRELSMLPEVEEAIQEITSEAIVFDELDDVITLNIDGIELPETIKKKIQSSYDRIG